MQIFAFDNVKRLISAKNAHKKADYFCRECGGAMRLRGGIHRQKHFFHLGLSDSCRQGGKSLTHLQVQYYLQNLFTLEDSQLERYFPEIDRIADVVWESQKLIFEVQCSPISKEEVENRNTDYRSQGYQVIWILHHNKFNRWRVSAAEIFLRGSPYYFTDINSQGKGTIYDQIDVIHGGVRRIFRKIFDVKLNQVNRQQDLNGVQMPQIPNVLHTRLVCWPFHFSGDLIDLWNLSEEEATLALIEAFHYERSYYKRAMNPVFIFLKNIINIILVRPYRIFFQIMLEKSCR